MVKRHYGIVTKEFKLLHFYYDVNEWELYAPSELNNVYENPYYAEIVKKLKNELAELRVKYKDSKELDQKYIQLYNKKE